MHPAEDREPVRSDLGRFVVYAIAIAVAVLMVWALYDGSARVEPQSESVAVSP